MEKVRIGILCDMHLPENPDAPQYAFFQRAIGQMKRDGVSKVICLGDTTAYGQLGAWALYQQALQDFEHYQVAGNSDIRDAATREKLLSSMGEPCFEIGSRRVVGINTAQGWINPKDRALAAGLRAGDILFMHHDPQSLEPQSAQWLAQLAQRTPLVLLHGHKHQTRIADFGAARLFGLRGLDPDKAIGNFPCLYELDVSHDAVRLHERVLALPKCAFESARPFFGISCVDNERDVAYAAQHGVRYLELRLNGANWTPDPKLTPLLTLWRKKTDGYLSVHMPTLKWTDGAIAGRAQWQQALEYALLLGADSLTMHPPRAPVSRMQPEGALWQDFLQLYAHAAQSVPENTRLGVENVHKLRGEALDENRGFGYTPDEICAWIRAVNAAVGRQRVGHVLDVGHARNNGAFSQQYPVGRWYRLMGQKTIAYHIHQVVREPAGLTNHHPIENWFGPMINYTGFFHAWQQQVLNHVPIFLEVRGCEHYAKSIEAFDALIRTSLPPLCQFAHP